MSDAAGTVEKSRRAELTIPSAPECMKLVRALIRAASECAGFEKPDVNHLCLAVDEACTNIIRHAYGGDHTKVIEVTIGIHPGRLDVTLRDYGKKSNPATFQPRALHDIRPGGLGVHFIREIMDEVVYDTSHETGMELRMSKSVPKPRQERHEHTA